MTSDLITLNPHPTRVVNVRVDAHTTYIGRPSFWGNPFPLPKKATTLERVECLLTYTRWLSDQPRHLDHIPMLKGQHLGCYCAPALCHGDILAYLADNHEQLPMAELLDSVITQLESIRDMIRSRPEAASAWAAELRHQLHAWRTPDDTTPSQETAPCSSTSES